MSNLQEFSNTLWVSSIHPQTLLAQFKGVLQADAHAGFNSIFDSVQVREAAC